MTCTYTLTDKDGKEITLTGQSELKAYLVDGGLSHLYPDGNFPWVENIDGGKNENNQINRKESKSAQARNIKDNDALDTQTSKESQAQALSDTAQERLSKDHVQNGNETHKFNQLQEQQNVSESGLVAKRGKPKNTIIFTTPISNKSGDKIVSYSWSWREGEKFDKHDGGLVNARVSDWDSAITNPETGRDIVHKFDVELANGEMKTVSLESAEKILGIKNLLTQVKGEVNRSWLRNINSFIKSVLNEYRPKDIDGKFRWDKQNLNFNKVYDAYMDLSEIIGDKKADEISLQNKEEYATSDRAISILLTKKGKQINNLVSALSDITGISVDTKETAHNSAGKDSEQQAEPKVDTAEPDAETEATDNEGLKYSKSSQEDIDFAQEIITELSDVDEFFRFPVSKETTLKGVMKDIAPNFQFVGNDTRADEKQESGADTRLLFKTDKGNDFYVYEKGNDIWIDVSRLNTGDRGSAIYAAVGNYAYNSGKVFIGDPDGLSNDAVIRRTANMLSMVLRFGTADFMEPSVEQRKGIPELGVVPLKWQGNDVDKTKSLIHTFMANLENNFPELSNVRYDFNKRDFIRTDNGVSVDWRKVAGERRRRGLGESARAGEATARRGVFIKSLMASESSERPGILEQVLRGANSLIKNGKLDNLFSKTTGQSKSNTYTKESLSKALEKELDLVYGKGWFNRLLSTDKFKVINRDEAKQYSANAENAQGFYHPESDTSFFVAENIGKDDNLKGLMLHEIGVHALQLGKNDAEFQSILKQLDVLKDKNTKIKAAYERILKDTKPEHRLEELAAYIVQNEPSLPVSKRIVAWFKNALRNIAKYVKGADKAALIKWANNIDENDVVFMANAALKSAPDSLVFSNVKAHDGIKYSQPADTTEDSALWPDEPNTENEWVDAVKTKLENLTDRAKVATYGAFTVRQLSTLGKNIMPQLKGFSALLQKRESLQNRYKNESGRLVDNHWKKLDSKTAYRINTVINESTLYDIDSSKEWTGIEKQDDVYVAYTQNVYSGPGQEKIQKRAASLGGKLVGKTKAEFTNKNQAEIFISALRDYKPTLSDQERQKQHKLNYARFQSLPKDAQYIYSDAFRQHDDLFNAKMAALEKRIAKAIFDEKKRSQFIATVRQQFESNRMNWYYAPLSRFGDYWLYGKIDNQPYFETFESEAALNRAKESFKGDLIGSGRKIEDMKDNAFDSVGEGFIANIQAMLQEAEASEELQDQVYQMFLETLPSVSMRKNSIHRQGIAGFDKDAMRGFSNSLWHGSKQLSNLMYNNEMSRLLSDSKKAIDVASSQSQVSQIENEIEAAEKLLDKWGYYPLPVLKNELDHDPNNKVTESMISLRKKLETLDVKDREKRLNRIIKDNRDLLESADKIRTQNNGPIQASKLVSEMNKAFEDMQKSDYSPLVQAAMQFNFVTMLGLSPAFFLVNTIQTPGVAMPRAFGRFGNLPKVMKIYGDSLADFMDAVVNRRKDEYGNWSLTATLKDKLAKAEQKGDTTTATRLRQEISAMDKFLKEGDVDKTQGYDLIGVAEEGAAHGGIMLKIAQTSGFLAHHSERMNREITLLSNFRLAREKGEGFRTAINTARELNIDAHLDYSSENTARFMRSPSLKLLTQFMKYKQGMYFLWFNSIHEAFKGASEADKKEGMRTAIGLVTMQTALAGTMGLPLMGALMTTLDLIGGMFDDDDKWDTKKEIRLGMHKVLSPLGEIGDKLAESIAMGVVNGFTPVELHSRLDLSDVIFRDPIKEMEGRDAGAYMVASLFGPTGGNVIDMYESVRLANDGLWARAVETFPFMPKFGADFLKAIRYGTEDARTQNDKLLKEMSKPEVILQALGLSSSNLSRKYDENSYTKNAERDITEARNKIIEKIAEGRIKGDMQLVAEGQREAQEWRTRHPEYPINAKSIRASIRARRRAEKNMQGSGIRVNPRLDYLRDENKIEG
jgi:hypothetical protein